MDALATGVRRDEQVRAFAANLPLSLAINSLLAASTFAILDPHARRDPVFAWLLAALAINLIRFVSVRLAAGSRAFPPAASRVTLKLCLGGSLLSGLTWSVVPAFLIDYATPQAPLVSIVLCGLTAGTALQGSAFAASVAAMTLPILMAMAAKLIAMETPGAVILAFDVALYQVMILKSTAESQRSFIAAIRLREDARSLAKQLSHESAAARAAAASYYQLANHDSLTGVANRAFFRRTLDAWLEEAGPTGAAVSGVALFLIDLDHFKAINDTRGHAAGDEVLDELARRLCDVAGPEGFVARLGGDEFVLLSRTGEDVAHADEVARAIMRCTDEPIRIGDDAVPIGLSLGVAAYPGDGESAGVLLKRADVALYTVKLAGRGGWRRFDAAMLRAAERAHDVEQDLAAALRDEALEVWFQPQVAIGSGRLTGLEALIRWRHPRHGWIPPPMIVDAALKARSSEHLTRLVLSRACALMRRLTPLGCGDAVVAVNISPREIGQYDLASLVRSACDAAAVDRTRLELEITEEHLLDDVASIATLIEVARAGVRLALDDFGTGCASLTYLRNLPLDRIKIDRCFVTGLADRPGDQVLVQAILGIGRALGVEVIAEGVESHEDALTLASLGCHLAQGYYFGAPMPETALIAHVEAMVPFATASLERLVASG